MLDKDLKLVSAPTVAVAGSNIADVRWLGGNDWLVVASGPDG